MRTTALAAAWLACAAQLLSCQHLSFPEGLQPYRINPILVEGVSPRAVRRIHIAGSLFDGREVPLFTGSGTPVVAGAVRCSAYLNEEVQSLIVRIDSSGGRTQELSVPIEPSAPRIAVYGAGTPLKGDWYAEASAPEELRPGDVFVLPKQDDKERLRAAGIHVLAPEGEETLAQPHPWRGFLIAAPAFGAADVLTTLERNRMKLFEFKERYRKLVSGASFHSPAVVQTLQKEILGDRVGPLYRYALLGFSLPLLAAVALLKNEKVPLILAGSLLAAFLVLSLLAPPVMRSLTVELALPSAVERSINLEEVFAEAGGRHHYRERGILPGSPSLLYRAALAPGGEVPLQFFAREELLRFNQIPEISQESGRLLLRGRNPLIAWSLHEPW